MKTDHKTRQTTPIKTIEIKFDHKDNVPHVILNGIDFQKEGIGLQELKLNWKTREGILYPDDNFVQISYLTKRVDEAEKRDILRKVSIKQFFQELFRRTE